jgi:hypothetical protein
MKSAVLALVAICAPVFAQSTFTNAGGVLFSAQNASSLVALQQSAGVLASRDDVSRCIPSGKLGDVQVFYVEPQKGHAPAWYSGEYDRNVSFRASVPPAGTQATMNSQTQDMQTGPWPNASAATTKISGVSTSQAWSSVTTSNWNASAAQPTSTTPISSNGKTYRSFGEQLQRPLPTPVEPQRYSDGIIFCR